jgi:integrase
MSKTSKSVQSYVDAALSESTRRSYLQGVHHFFMWGGKIPATQESLAEYLVAHCEVLKVATLEHRLAAIHHAHEVKSLESPVKSRLVKQTMEGIRRTFGTQPRRVNALVKDDLLEILVNVERQKPLRAARDKAMLLVGWAAALRRSELVALAVEDVVADEKGMWLRIRRSKTDQQGKGQSIFIPTASVESRCPVIALCSWLQLAGIQTGALFRQVSRHDRIVGSRSLSPQAVALVVQAAVSAAKGHKAAQDFAGHSLRSGYVTTAVELGLQPTEIMRVTRHKSVAVLLEVYVRPHEKRQTKSLL